LSSPKKKRRKLAPLAAGEQHGKWLLLAPAEYHKTKGRQWLCRCVCGNERIVRDLSIKHGVSASCGCYRIALFDVIHRRPREEQPSWRGGMHVDKGGYVRIYLPEHPSINGKTSCYVKEHTLVMEKHLGRFLLPGETVHHRNGQKQDNRIENLELWSSSHRPGQRVSDLLAWAREILQQYEGVELP
jgi:hypothetical protein